MYLLYETVVELVVKLLVAMKALFKVDVFYRNKSYKKGDRIELSREEFNFLAGYGYVVAVKEKTAKRINKK
jgi:hypothetical protein